MIISDQTALKELRQSSRTTGIYTNITDDDIDNAEPEPPKPELFGQAPGAEGGGAAGGGEGREAGDPGAEHNPGGEGGNVQKPGVTENIPGKVKRLRLVAGEGGGTGDAAAWSESEHKRDPDGKFASVGHHGLMAQKHHHEAERGAVRGTALEAPHREAELAHKEARAAHEGYRLNRGALSYAANEKSHQLGIAHDESEADPGPSHFTLVPGLDVMIETPKGAVRPPHQRALPAAYGHIRGTMGTDGDECDCFVGPESDRGHDAWAIWQVDPHTGAGDEWKVMLGYPDRTLALRDYQRAFDDGLGAARIGAVRRFDLVKLKDWLDTGGSKRAA
jgi:hypothetical protein